jgi:hypothetical protein
MILKNGGWLRLSFRLLHFHLNRSNGAFSTHVDNARNSGEHLAMPNEDRIFSSRLGLASLVNDDIDDEPSHPGCLAGIATAAGTGGAWARGMTEASRGPLDPLEGLQGLFESAKRVQ